MIVNVNRIFQSMIDKGVLNRNDLVGCNAEEMDQIRAHFSVHIPAYYEEFLRLAGKSAGGLFRGSDIFFPRLLKLQKWANELLSENNEKGLPESAMVIFMHQGYEFCFILPGKDDPSVFQYVEGQKGFSETWQKFSEFLEQSLNSQLNT